MAARWLQKPLPAQTRNAILPAGRIFPSSASRVPKLRVLQLIVCWKITALPDVSGCAALKRIDLIGCDALRAMPDLSSLEGLGVGVPIELEQQWEANGRKACSV